MQLTICTQGENNHTNSYYIQKHTSTEELKRLGAILFLSNVCLHIYTHNYTSEWNAVSWIFLIMTVDPIDEPSFQINNKSAYYSTTPRTKRVHTSTLDGLNYIALLIQQSVTAGRTFIPPPPSSGGLLINVPFLITSPPPITA